MSNWYDEHNNNTPDDSSKASSTPTDPTVKADETKPMDSEVKAVEPPPSSGWSTVSSSFSQSPGTSSWNAQNDSFIASQAKNNPPSTTTNPSVPAGSTTYHYGVNSPNQLPSNENKPQQPYSSVPGGYRPQGNYDPYGWQRYQNQPGMQSSMQPGPPSNKPPKKKRGAKIAIASLATLCAGAIVTLSVLLAMSLSNGGPIQKNNNSNVSQSNGVTNSTRDVNSNAPSLQIADDTDDASALSTRSIVDMNLNSTVVITTYTSQSSYGFGTSGNQLTEAGAATGIVMTADGYVITNWHVVINEATGKAYNRIDVKTYDGTVYEGAEVIGFDQYTDLAVIKVGAVNLTPAQFGDSAALHLGDKVVAIGNAGGLAWTTTQGIVSGLARDVYEDTGYAIKCLQIDAAINPGNSGGPLLNSQGQVVAINSAKIVASGYEGLGFSIPINEAKTIVDDLVKYGYVKGRVMLGITGRTITQSGYEGFRIEGINSDSCLIGTNAQVGDIITHVQGTRVKDYAAMRTELAKYAVGDSVEMTLMRVDSRSGSSSTITVKCILAESKT